MRKMTDIEFSKRGHAAKQLEPFKPLVKEAERARRGQDEAVEVLKELAAYLTDCRCGETHNCMKCYWLRRRAALVRDYERASGAIPLSAEILEKKAKWLADAAVAFSKAGFEEFSFKERPNEYWPESPDYYEVREANPVLEVTTGVGTFVLRPRKRVLDIDWSGTVVSLSGEEIFPEVEDTKGSKSDSSESDRGCFIHAWKDEQTVTYLRKVREIALASGKVTRRLV